MHLSVGPSRKFQHDHAPLHAIGTRDRPLMNYPGTREGLPQLVHIGLEPFHVSVGVSNPCAWLCQSLQFRSGSSRQRCIPQGKVTC